MKITEILIKTEWCQKFNSFSFDCQGFGVKAADF